jgi:hypothetical protein
LEIPVGFTLSSRIAGEGVRNREYTFLIDKVSNAAIYIHPSLATKNRLSERLYSHLGHKRMGRAEKKKLIKN